jgi:hypothetical protein
VSHACDETVANGDLRCLSVKSEHVTELPTQVAASDLPDGASVDTSEDTHAASNPSALSMQTRHRQRRARNHTYCLRTEARPVVHTRSRSQAVGLLLVWSDPSSRRGESK